MAIELKLRKGTAAQNDAFTGAEGEVTVDTTNSTLRVHDGSTAGGTIAGKTYAAGTGITLTGDQFSISDNGVGASQLKVADNGTSGQVLISDGDGTFSWQSIAGYDSSDFNTDFTAKSTDDLTEGTSNLYFTDSRARNAIAASGDLSYNSSTGVVSFIERTDSQVRDLFSASGDITYDSNTGTFSATIYKSTDFDTDFGTKSTDDLTEGTTNLYYSNTLVDTHLSGGTGVTYSSGTIFIGQDVSTTSDVTFNNVTVDGTLTSDDITAATVTTSGNLTVQGDLTINGTTTTVNSNVVEIGDSILTLNADLGSTTAPSQNGGITINRGSGADKSFVWDETADKWTIGTDTLVAGTVEANVTGTVSDISNHSTDNLSEGSSNLYYTDARVDSRVGNGTLTINAGNSLTGGGTFSANQSSNSTVTINHADTSSQGSVNNSGNTFIQDITVDGYGHITGINSGSVSGFAQENTSVTFTTVTANDFNSTSDIRRKTNVETIDNASTKISNLRGVSFNWVENGEPSIGLIAQELEEIIPEVVSTGEDGFKTVSYGNLIGLLIEAIKDQQNQIDDLARQLYK